MTLEDLARLAGKAMAQAGTPLGTMIAVTPRELIELCRLARIGLAQEAAAGKPE